MAPRILTDNQRKEKLSYAFVAALAARDGLTFQPGPDPDMDSIDATVRCGPPSREVVDLQLKATSNAEKHSDGLHFRLKLKSYSDLVTERAVPLVLVVLELPADESRWLDCTLERMILRKCGWWISLAGRDPLDAGSATVVIPRTQRFGQSGLAPLFAHLRRRTS